MGSYAPLHRQPRWIILGGRRLVDEAALATCTAGMCRTLAPLPLAPVRFGAPAVARTGDTIADPTASGGPGSVPGAIPSINGAVALPGHD